MRHPPNRDPRAPQLAGSERPELAREAFVDEAVDVGLRLEDIQFADIEAEKVELKRFVLTEVDLSGAKLDGLDLGMIDQGQQPGKPKVPELQPRTCRDRDTSPHRCDARRATAD